MTSLIIVYIFCAVGLVVIIAAIWLKDRACPDCGRHRGTPPVGFTFNPAPGRTGTRLCANRDFHPPP